MVIDLKRNFLILIITTVLLLFLIAMEILGDFNNLNMNVENMIPYSDSSLMKFFSWTASIEFTLIILFVLFLFYIFQRNGMDEDYVAMVVSMIIAMLIVLFLKAYTREPRPGEAALSYTFLQALKNADYFSFPSGHAARSSVLACYASRKGNTPIKVLSWIWAFGIALSRLVLRAHWLSDVITSLILGIFSWSLTETLRKLWTSWYNSTFGKIRLLRIKQYPKT